MTSIENVLIQTHLNQTIIALTATSMFQSPSPLPNTGLLVTLLTLTAHHLVFICWRGKPFCDSLRTVLDMHAPSSLRKFITHNSSPWFESIRDELYMAKIEKRQAERKWRNTKLTIFKDLYIQASHKVSKLVHTAKCKFYNE